VDTRRPVVAGSWFGGQWAERLTRGALAEQIVSEGLSNREELEVISEARRG
jgi:hypothetical protein